MATTEEKKKKSTKEPVVEKKDNQEKPVVTPAIIPVIRDKAWRIKNGIQEG